MGVSRHAARERALELAYEAEQRGLDAGQLLADLPVPPDDFARLLFAGAEEHRDEIDTLIRRYSEHWAIERMPVLDRALLRLGAFELGWVAETPTAVVITEAVALAREFSTRDSGRFVNGLLARLADDLRGPGAAEAS